MSKKVGHHGGSWKVAYADFVTAMMALFLVLWLTSQDTKIKEAVERSFKNPYNSITEGTMGVIKREEKKGSTSPISSKGVEGTSLAELAVLRRLNMDLQQNFPADDVNPQPIRVDMSGDNLRISVFDRNNRPIFKTDSVEFTEYGNWVFTTLGWVIAKYKDCVIELEGHTEKGHKTEKNDYGVWELTADRANAARRKLEQHGLLAGQVAKVAGYGDTIPLQYARPEDESNRRVTVLLKAKGKTS